MFHLSIFCIVLTGLVIDKFIIMLISRASRIHFKTDFIYIYTMLYTSFDVVLQYILCTFILTEHQYWYETPFISSTFYHLYIYGYVSDSML